MNVFAAFTEVGNRVETGRRAAKRVNRNVRPTAGYFLYDYLSPTVMLMSLTVFVAARGWRPKHLSTARMRKLGAATFGIFLIHPLLLMPIQRSLGLPDGAHFIRTVEWAVPLAVVVCVASGVIVMALCRVPGVRRLIS